MPYDVQILPGGEGFGIGINNNGSVVGATLFFEPPEPTTTRATVWPISNPSEYQTFRPPFDLGRINDAGDAIGYPLYLLTGNEMIDLTGPITESMPKHLSVLYDLNAKFVVGGASRSVEIGGGASGFMYDWVAHELTLIPPLSGYESSLCCGINSKNEVVGAMDDHAFIYQAGQVHDLGPGYLRDINDQCLAVGEFHGTPVWLNCNDHDAALKPIPLPPSCTAGQAFAINNDGTIVGIMTFGRRQVGFVYDLRAPNVPAQDLNNLSVLDSVSLFSVHFSWFISMAFDINDEGQIVGTASYTSLGGDGLTRALVLTPQKLNLNFHPRQYIPWPFPPKPPSHPPRPEWNERELAELKTTVVQQQKQIEALAAGLEKVSAQLEASKPRPSA